MIEGDSGPNKDAADPMVGKVLNGRFSIIEVIGKGGMGRVYKAIQAPLDRVVALKVLDPHYGSNGRDPNFQKRFFLEASLTSKLRSPNTITVHDYGRTDDGIYYIAMEYVEGHTLAQELATTGPFPWQRALHIAQQICRSLREAHKNGIVHRDLKPANVMLLAEESDQDRVKVLDFGLVKSMATHDEPEITQAGMMLGSPLYMAPEQAKHIADARTDIYSLGVVLYQMLMGRPPFVSRESVDAIVMHISQPVPPFAHVRPDITVPPEIEAVVMKCLEKNPDKRFQSMDEVLEAMRAAASAQGVSGLFSPPHAASTSPIASTPALGSAPHLAPSDSEVGVTRAERFLPTIESPSEISIEVQLPDSAQASRKLSFAAVFAAALVVGAAGVFFATRSSWKSDDAQVAGATDAQPVRSTEPPQPASKPTSAPAPIVHAPAEARPAHVRFHVASEPAGARVSWGNRDLGSAPLSFDVPPGIDGVAEATLTFTLEGYQPLTVTARGQGPEVSVSERLQKKAGATNAKKTRTDPRGGTDKGAGYKDDPYQ